MTYYSQFVLETHFYSELTIYSYMNFASIYPANLTIVTCNHSSKWLANGSIPRETRAGATSQMAVLPKGTIDAVIE